MTERLLDVTVSTTLDVADGHVYGPDWQDDAAAVVDVDSPEPGGTVTLALELDPLGATHVDHHVDAVSLTPYQARLLARALEDAAFDAEPTFEDTHRAD